MTLSQVLRREKPGFKTMFLKYWVHLVVVYYCQAHLTNKRILKNIQAKINIIQLNQNISSSKIAHKQLENTHTHSIASQVSQKKHPHTTAGEREIRPNST